MVIVYEPRKEQVKAICFLLKMLQKQKTKKQKEQQQKRIKHLKNGRTTKYPKRQYLRHLVNWKLKYFLKQ
jgi:hypothetical protein